MVKIGPQEKKLIMEAIARRGDGGADMQALVDAFVKDEPGARLFVSDGDGRVSLLVPVRDAYEGLDRIQLAPSGNLANIMFEAKKSARPVEVEGVGKFYEFVLEPFEVRKKALEQAADSKRAELGLRGSGGLSDWSPLGDPEAWFFDYVDVLLSLAAEGGVAIGPGAPENAAGMGEAGTAPKKRGRGWSPMSEEDIAAAEEEGRRMTESGAGKLLEQGRGADEVSKGGLKGIALVLEDPPLAQPDEIDMVALIAAAGAEAWPGAWYLPALDADLSKLSLSPDRIELSGAGQVVKIEKQERFGVASYSVTSGAEKHDLAEADPRAAERLLELLLRRTPEGTAHPLLAELRRAEDEAAGSPIAGLVLELKGLVEKKLALRNAVLEREKQKFRAARKRVSHD